MTLALALVLSFQEQLNAPEIAAATRARDASIAFAAATTPLRQRTRAQPTPSTWAGKGNGEPDAFIAMPVAA